jgi:ABC-type lipoprotein release transport system permease subunit
MTPMLISVVGVAVAVILGVMALLLMSVVVQRLDQMNGRLASLVAFEEHKRSYRSGISTKPGREILRQRLARRVAEGEPVE